MVVPRGAGGFVLGLIRDAFELIVLIAVSALGWPMFVRCVYYVVMVCYVGVAVYGGMAATSRS